MIVNNTNLILFFGITFVVLIWIIQKKIPDYHSAFEAFLAGGLLYAAIGGLFWAITGTYFLNDNIDSFRINVGLSAIAFMLLTINVIKKESRKISKQ